MIHKKNRTPFLFSNDFYCETGSVVGLQHPNVSGKIVFIPDLHWGKKYDEARRKGAIAIILTSHVFEAGLLNYARYTILNEPVHLLKPGLPTVEGSGDDFKDAFYLLLTKYEGSYLEFPCTLSSTDKNPWKHYAFYGSLFISLGIGFLCLLALFLALYKIYIIGKYNGLEITVPLACLYIEVFANTLRSIFILVDPIFMRRLFPVTLWSFMSLGLISLSLATTVLLAFYWHGLLFNANVSQNNSPFGNQKLLIPSIVVITIFVLLDITNGILWSFGKSLTLIKVFNSILFVASFASGVYLVVTGSLVLWKISRAQTRTLKMLRMITIQIMASSVFIFFVAITGLVSVFGVFTGPGGFITLFIIHWIPLLLISITQISAIRRKPKQQTSSSSTANITPSVEELGRIE